MVVLPLIRRLSIANYALFPGYPEGTGIDFEVRSGVSLIAGINGLGKTTLITVLLRLLTGPYDLSGAGLPAQTDSVTPEEPTRLRAGSLRFFGQRVADDAREATATIQLSFRSTDILITRELHALKLLNFKIQGKSALDEGDPEKSFQESICKVMNLSSFVDVLFVLHYIVFFPEGRHGTLWDLNAQRHLLRAVLLPKSAAARIAELERKVGSADSLARNLGYALNTQETRLREAQELHAVAPKLRATLRSAQVLLDADLEKRAALESQRDILETERRAARLNLERAKIEREDAERAVEKIKFSVLSRMFPEMSDVARLTVLNLLSKSTCLVCGARSEAARVELEKKLSHGICPICDSPPEAQANIVPVREVEANRLKKIQKRAALALSEEQSQQLRWNEVSRAYEEAVTSLQKLTNRVDELQVKIRGIAAELPTPSHEMSELQRSITQMKRDVDAAKSRRAELARALRKAFQPVNKIVTRSSARLERKYAAFSKMLLSEEAKLTRVEGAAHIAQAAEQFPVPLFQTDMSAAARPGLTRRSTAQDVSESQRELIDLAFRFALIEAATDDGDATLVMETPEASLDGIAMERVGRALCAFASTRENRLIATSNLSNAGVIGFLFGGAVKRKQKELRERRRRTINLLEVGAKNQALLADVKGRYATLLERALEGRDVVV